MPGRADSGAGWGRLPLLIDTSAWARARHPEVRETWTEVLLGRRLRLSPAVRLEILFSARDGEAFDLLAEQLTAIGPAPLTPSVVEAAAAQELGAAVIHYDRDYDALAELMEFESVWLAPPGTLP